MKPILFATNETNFTSNGLGRLECISCVATEERNGAYEIEIEISVSSPHASEIVMNSLIGVIPHDGGTIQAFRVYEISKPIHGRYTVYARHLSYDLSHIPCMPFSVANSPSAAADTMAGLKSNAVEACPFTFWTDLTTANSYKQKLPASIRQRLGGIEGSVLDQFGGEYEFDNYAVKLHKQRGRINTGITLRYGKNITDITQEESIASTITGICPYWSDVDGVEVVTLPEKVVYSQYADRYPFHLTEVHDFSQLYENKPSESSLRSAAQAYVNKSDLGIPKVSIDVSFVALWQTEEYKDIAPLERVQLCDEIDVYFEKLDITTTAKVVKTEYDVLAERYKSIQVGNMRTTLEKVLTDKEAETIQSIDAGNLKTLRQANATAVDAINNATAWLTGSNGYVMAVKNPDGSWKELLFMDTNNTATARNVLRINTNGLGFSTTGIDGPYTNAWTIDGNLVASFIKTGILSDLAGKFSLNMTDGTLNMKDGTFSGMVTGSTINVGTFNDQDGVLNIYNSAGQKIGTWDKTGLSVNGKFKVDMTGAVTIDGGSININNKFKVDQYGNLTTTGGAKIKGNIESGSNINGASISGGSITIQDEYGNDQIIIDSNGIALKNGLDVIGVLDKDGISIKNFYGWGNGEVKVGALTVYTDMKTVDSNLNIWHGKSDHTYWDANGNSIHIVNGIVVD